MNWIIVFYILTMSGFIRIESYREYDTEEICLEKVAIVEKQEGQPYDLFNLKCEQKQELNYINVF